MNIKNCNKKVISIIGARPQFIKASVVAKKIHENNINHLLIHTGQHYDFNMSDIFFNDLKIDNPDFYLGIGSGLHGEQTGKIISECEKILLKEQPFLVLVYGDTNTTLAGALAAVKLKIPVAHVEAGLRSYIKYMPEEINRVLTDHISELFFVPTDTAHVNLKKESITQNIYQVGDVMLDIALDISKKMKPLEEEVLKTYQLKRRDYILATIHREDNTDIENNLFNIFEALKCIAFKDIKIIFPVHPRTKKYLEKYGFFNNEIPQSLILNEPISYNDMIVLEKNARVIITDSGGVQKEAYFFKIPAVIPRKTTEWVEITETGWNILTGADKKRIEEVTLQLWDSKQPEQWHQFYGNGDAAVKIADIIRNFINIF